MSNSGDESDDDAFDIVREVLADPDSGNRQLPDLVGLLDEDNRVHRLAGAFGLSTVAIRDPDSVEYVINRLSDRFESDGHAEASLAFDYLITQFPHRIDAALQNRDAETTPSSEGESEPAESETAESDDTEEVSPPGVGSYGPRNVRESGEPDSSQDQNEEGQQPAEEREPPRPENSQPSPARVDQRQTWDQLFDHLSTITGHSRFDELVLTSSHQQGRYADVARVLAHENGVEEPVAMRIFYQPRKADPESFDDHLGRVLKRWEAVGDHPGIVSIYDWNLDPQPWAATEHLEMTLNDRLKPLEPEVALSLTLDLADALANAHRQGVVHGGIDPQNIGLPNVEQTVANEDVSPKLSNVGLLEVYRWHITPALLIDPRYAAPEYYDRRFGQVNNTTDVYQLGAVLYRMLTGRPPFQGEFKEIRKKVMNASPPKPSVRVKLPDIVDRIVIKAMTKRSLKRYETINDFRQDIIRVHDELIGHER